MRALIADDDPVVTTVIAAALTRDGWRVTTVHDAMQALMFAARAPLPDVIVLDLSMPAGTGFHALQRLKASTKTAHIPVVVLTGSDDPDAPARVMALGAQSFVHKPVDPNEFARLVESSVESHA
jgi:two-component system cell cycle response regulator